MIILFILSIAICIILWITCAFLSLELREKKGYENGLFLAFLLGVMYLIYCAGLPLSDQIKNYDSDQARNSNIETAEKISICQNCGYQIFEDEKFCKNCGKQK